MRTVRAGASALHVQRLRGVDHLTELEWASTRQVVPLALSNGAGSSVQLTTGNEAPTVLVYGSDTLRREDLGCFTGN